MTQRKSQRQKAQEILADLADMTLDRWVRRVEVVLKLDVEVTYDDGWIVRIADGRFFSRRVWRTAAREAMRELIASLPEYPSRG